MAAGSARLPSLDILRGVALLGMILVHLNDFTDDSEGVNAIISTSIDAVFSAKARAMFAMLFGAGLAIQWKRWAPRDERGFVSFALRRMTVLAAAGVLAEVGFGYSVLLGYAAMGTVLVFMRRWSTRALCVAALVSLSAMSITQLVSAVVTFSTIGPTQADTRLRAVTVESRSLRSDVRDAQAGSSYPALVAARSRLLWWEYVRPASLIPSSTLALLIVGFLAMRLDIFAAPLRHRQLLLAAMVFGVSSWIAGRWLLPAIVTPISLPPIPGQISPTLGLISTQWLAFTWMGGALLAFAAWPALAAPLSFIGIAGRMPLTNYLIQVAALDILASGYGLGVDTMRATTALACGVGLFATLCVFSALWLRRFAYGPVEWLWRYLTYGRRPGVRTMTVS